MKNEVNPGLEEALRELGRATTPDELRRRGVRRVLSVGKSDVSRLIEIAVNRTLLARTVGGLSDDERRFVIDTAEEVFSGDVRTLSDLADSRATIRRERAEIEDELADLKRHLYPAGTGFEEIDEANRAERMKPVRLRVQARLLPIFELLPPGAPTLRVTVAALMEVFTDVYETGIAEERAQMSDRVENLERRIAKLMRSLDQTESVLARLAEMKDLEEGIESIYRSVQGLNPSEANRERKMAMMKTIFEANLEIQAPLAS